MLLSIFTETYISSLRMDDPGVSHASRYTAPRQKRRNAGSLIGAGIAVIFGTALFIGL